MSKVIRIGTRNSPLALWQANVVKSQLERLGYQTQLIPITSTGDIVLDKPLYELGITGIFTKTLDVAMIQGQIDIAVHSMKDVPTLLPKGIIQTAVLERASHDDILVTKELFNYEEECTIATGSLRRKAQWLNRYPHHKVVGLRGNVNTRLQSLANSDWQGAIFAKAGLERIDLLPENYQDLHWMIPAPAQGAMVVVANEDDTFCVEATSKLNHKDSQVCTGIEREFLRVLEGGCTAPIGAFAEVIGNQILFKGILLSLDGKEKIEIEETTTLSQMQGFGRKCAEYILSNGGKTLMQQIKNEMSN
ncbi:hydroxymethylbilane synthase [Aureisphaera sp. CAU 1614]|uniref:Hydroxymethylbilane synthase n=1 Tax=Halomarinibacterium sedimenti TaxID=2857106 RepID=A0A9X1JWM5_9FLAO|nr:hydroxymethylbilane synthase [Halomarinibacterium sedimenti]MBW2937173.1 hydroxymethylbilane synthase [Halomarinibacterium sedimenti]